MWWLKTQEERQAEVDKAMRSDDPREREACQRLIDLGRYPKPSWSQKKDEPLPFGLKPGHKTLEPEKDGKGRWGTPSGTPMGRVITPQGKDSEGNVN